jgi:hypothetical protein
LLLEELLQANHIALDDFTLGRHYTTCPQCSAQRSNAHRTLKCLGVTIEPDKVFWGCNHCGWQGPEKGAKAKANGAGKTELPTYEYRDASGVIRFRKVRLNWPGGEKTFWLEQPDGRGGWLKNTKGVDTKVLYRIDEIAKAIAEGRVVCVVEGEKDADNLWRLGFAATCNAHGASEPGKKPKWYASHSAQLQGAADLVVFNDHDASGYQHADAACRLSLGVAKRVRRLDLKHHWPDIPPKSDISDWLAQGHGREELAALIDRAPEYTSGAASAETAQPATAQSGEASAADDDAELERLAKLPPIQYDRARKAAAEALGVRASMLDRVIAAKRAELGLDDGDGKQGRPIEFPEIKLWPAPVKGPEMLDDLAVALGLHVMSADQRVAVALWVTHAYLLDRLMISPRLSIRSAVKGSGKTTLLDVVARLVPRPLLAANVSASAIFRVIAAHGLC